MQYQLLIVDDEPMLFEYIEKFYPWDQLGFSIAGKASNGKEALVFLDQTPVDVVLTDIRMPVMDGLALARALAERHSREKVVLFSAYEDFSYAKEAIEAGVAGYLIKSEDPTAISAYFRRLHSLLNIEHGHAPDPEDPSAAYLPPTSILPVPQDASWVVRMAVDFIRENYAQDLKLAKVASHVAVHPVHLSRCLSEQYGKSYSEILTESRMEAAKSLLRQTNDRVYEISNAVGYRKSAYFIEQFRRYTGMTPQNYRDRGTSP